MPFHQPDSIRYHTFESFDDAGVCHGTLTRHGGVSPAPWAALNVGGTVGDDPACVLENRQRSFATLGRAFESLYDVFQVHGNEVVCTPAPRPPEQPHLQSDAILTDQPGVTLFMRFADCVPVFLYDPLRRVVGLAHAGWQGTVLKTAARAVTVMHERYGSSPADILAGIGPSIGAHHYEVGPEVADRVRQAFGADAAELLLPVAGDLRASNGNPAGYRVQFDLWRANRLALEQVGVRRVETAGLCTACALQDWYSHRGEHGRTGRFGAMIGL
jgi:polyphenol oxidase